MALIKKYYKLLLLCISFSCKLSAQTWIQKVDLGGIARNYAVGFSIGNKGYIGTGYGGGSNECQDFWEWDQATNAWTQKANFGGTGRLYAVGFSIGTKGYIGLGNTDLGDTNDLWEWDGDIASPTYNTWSQKAYYPGQGRKQAVGFSIGKKGYIGTGYPLSNDFWEWDGDTASTTNNTWVQKANFGGGIRAGAVGFSIGKKGYIGTGNSGTWNQDFWEWDGDTASPAYNTWTQKANFGGGLRMEAVGFSIGNKGYIGTGDHGVWLNDFWEWDRATNIWKQKESFITARANAVGFSIGSKGYIGTGNDSTPTFYRNDFWEYCDTCSPVSINEINNAINISVFPNPSNGNFILQSNSQKGEITIYNIKGSKIHSSKVNSDKEEIDISNQQEGVYFVQIKSADGIAAKKIIVQR